jgi:pyroglutamyl-peptidase
VTRVLLSAFEPFGGERVNPSQLAVRRLAEGPPIEGVELSTTDLPVVFGQAIDALLTAIRRHDPEVVICVGEAGGRFAVTPERVAVNVNDAPFPDNAGQLPVDEPIVPGGPVAYLSGLPVAELVEALREAGIPAAKSSTAENYVCNNVFYGLMHHIATERPDLVGGFVHVPYIHEQVLGRLDPQPSLSLDMVTEALRVVVRTAVASAARNPSAPVAT